MRQFLVLVSKVEHQNHRISKHPGNEAYPT